MACQNIIRSFSIIKKKLCFLLRDLCSWYREHYGELSCLPYPLQRLIKLDDLEDPISPCGLYHAGFAHGNVVRVLKSK